MYLLPNITLPAGFKLESMLVTNTTYAALSMLTGDSFGKQFGGASGDDPDYFKITAFGTDNSGNLLGSSDFYLADYRFDNNTLDYVVNTWTPWDLTALGDSSRVYFNVSSTDVGQYGMNTPGYFAVDNLQITAVPEPSSIVLMLAAAVGLSVFYRRAR
jgi:hypothetical protein